MSANWRAKTCLWGSGFLSTKAYSEIKLFIFKIPHNSYLVFFPTINQDGFPLWNLLPERCFKKGRESPFEGRTNKFEKWEEILWQGCLWKDRRLRLSNLRFDNMRHGQIHRSGSRINAPSSFFSFKSMRSERGEMLIPSLATMPCPESTPPPF